MSEDYVVASREESLGASRALLERLYGIDLVPFDDADEGLCDDCGLIALRVRYGRLRLCRRCASARRRAGRRMAA